jgi:murein DD-endopeptidase MepM/ murein hydrolase activator NlpD
MIQSLIIGAGLLSFVSCNYPGIKREPVAISDQEIHQTIAAQLASTLSASAGSPATDATARPQATMFPKDVLASPGQPGPGVPSLAGSYLYLTQTGDTLSAIARRFRVDPLQVSATVPLPKKGYFPPGQVLAIPAVIAPPVQNAALLPDSEVINSPAALDFDAANFINQAGGYLSAYSENVYGKTMSGAEILKRVATESSVNPRLLLAFLEYRSGWVFGQPRSPDSQVYPLGFRIPDRRGLYQELAMAATHLNIGYYGWRTGEFTNLRYADGSTTAIDPWLNPGTVGVQNLFAKFYKPNDWRNALYGDDNFPTFYKQIFGDAWSRDAQVQPLLPSGLSQPDLELPFARGERWSLTAGPHPSWNTGSPRGALDFAPVTGEPACSVSKAWVTAPAPGIIARAENNVVALDLDGDGNEQTGWVIVFLHIADQDRILSGQLVTIDDRIGHPSCERGQSTGTHVHIARKFNGEWLEADGPVPMILSGWLVQAETRNYLGYLIKENQKITANPGGAGTSIIVR